ncbi:hypothetical protein LZC95_48975 [Pendulispora brunnea]|uniref:Uncharacterized protein n=1 Tax=Pendulispora brunnea TaxID=2905690 RepID=A0ABZ2K6P4_9BACT
MTIIPHQGVGPILFGMTRDEVTRAIGRRPDHRHKRTELDVSESDFYDLFVVSFDGSGVCYAVEFHVGAGRLIYDGYDLFGHPASETRDWARSKDPNLEEDEGFVSKALGLSMYAPLIDVPDLDEDDRTAPGQGFMVFRPGYYEEEEEHLKDRSFSTDN